jgi:hypothetical protein
MSTLAKILARLDALEARLTAPRVNDGDPILEMSKRLALIRERLDEAGARDGGCKRQPGSPSGSRLSELIENARKAEAAGRGAS